MRIVYETSVEREPLPLRMENGRLLMAMSAPTYLYPLDDLGMECKG